MNTGQVKHIKLRQKRPEWIRKQIPCERCGDKAWAMLVKDVSIPGRLDIYWLCWSCLQPIRLNPAIDPETLNKYKVSPMELPTIIDRHRETTE